MSPVLSGDINRYLLPCPFKYLTGFDCPGCGFQRSLLALLRADLVTSFHLYPATLPILITMVLSLVVNRWYPKRSKIIIKALFVVTSAIILVSYGLKIFMPHTHSDHI